MRQERILFIIPPYFDVADYSAENRASVLPPYLFSSSILFNQLKNMHYPKPTTFSTSNLNIVEKHLDHAIDLQALPRTDVRSDFIGSAHPRTISTSQATPLKYYAP